MSKNCAYCGQATKLTREHIFPRFLYELCPNQLTGHNAAADKVTSSERVISDVCEKCNAGPLCALDSYGRRYFDQNSLQSTYTTAKRTAIIYDYHLLLRWLLKISFNSYRTIHDTPGLFSPLIPYILEGKPSPQKNAVQLYIEVVRDHKFEPHELSLVPNKFARIGYLPCLGFRSGFIGMPHELSPHLSRHFQLNSHFFVLLIFPPDIDPSSRKRIEGTIQAAMPDLCPFATQQTRMDIQISRRDSLDVFHDYLHPKQIENEAQYFRERNRE